MAVVLDTNAFAVEDRVPAVIDAMRSTTAPCDVRYADPADRIFTRMSAWQIGDVDIWRNEASGMEMIRTPKHVAQGFDGRVAIAIQLLGESRIEYGGAAPVGARPGDLICVDLTKPYHYAWADHGSAFCVSVQHEQLEMPLDDIFIATQRLQASPLYDLFRRHLLDLANHIDRLQAGLAAEATAKATSELLRGLLSSVSTSDALALAGLNDSQFARIRAQIQQSLRDPTLNPESIAHATNISVRQLYRVCAANDFSIEQNVTMLRLLGARKELGESNDARQSIATVARRWGFSSPAHFSRRFKQVFGTTPREWQMGARTD